MMVKHVNKFLVNGFLVHHIYILNGLQDDSIASQLCVVPTGPFLLRRFRGQSALRALGWGIPRGSHRHLLRSAKRGAV